MGLKDRGFRAGDCYFRSMRNLRLALFASATAIVFACSSESSGPGSNAGDGGSGNPDTGSNPQDGAMPDPGSDASTGSDSSKQDAAAPFVLTSTAFAEGGSIPAINTCTVTNESPPLTWTAGPAATKSYAVILLDTNNQLIHSIIYDIPPAVTSLPAGVQKVYAPGTPAGAHQTKPGFGAGFGYAGPCPPEEHIYSFTVYALDVATLPGADMTTTTLQGDPLIKAHSLGSAKLSGKYKKP